MRLSLFTCFPYHNNAAFILILDTEEEIVFILFIFFQVDKWLIAPSPF